MTSVGCKILRLDNNVCSNRQQTLTIHFVKQSKGNRLTLLFSTHSSRDLKLDLESLACPDSLSIVVKQPRNRHHGQCDKRQEGVTPPETQRLVHSQTTEREQGANERPEHRVGSHCARSVDGKCVDEVGGDCHLRSGIE